MQMEGLARSTTGQVWNSHKKLPRPQGKARAKADEDPGSRRQYAFPLSPAWAQGLFARHLFSAIEDVRSTLSVMRKIRNRIRLALPLQTIIKRKRASTSSSSLIILEFMPNMPDPSVLPNLPNPLAMKKLIIFQDPEGCSEKLGVGVIISRTLRHHHHWCRKRPHHAL
ncbi:uncharacterized protein K444DRAFT_669696 [Hyaloscypha bicolor E]|uniref:Uncharacterized protein n=1 Tax=Hyaloscypha bicolor E TaxID=1095630 RepID=A0A2J6SMQ0_9HELO|nr:uncharacterized protein K444DRAFT_669696 [Hyaloscypha bicolor E]PMD52033.1 hypothetical protein K444DRAFT_669696 [Hyaloscypha bicolor E]